MSKTTLFGIMAASGTVLLMIANTVDFTGHADALLCVKVFGTWLTGMGSALVGIFARDWNRTSEQEGLKPLNPMTEGTGSNASQNFIKAGLAFLMILMLSGCEFGKRDTRVVAALQGSVTRYETRVANATAREERWEDATRDYHTKAVRTAADRSVDIIAANPVKYPNQAQAVHEVDTMAAEKIAKQEVILQKMRDLRRKDDEINLAGARLLMSKVMQFDQAPAVDLTGAVDAILNAPAKLPNANQ